MADLRNLAAALRPSVDLLAAAGETDRHAVRSCARCGCTDERACVGTIGPCWWSAADLCCYCAAPRLEFRALGDPVPKGSWRVVPRRGGGAPVFLPSAGDKRARTWTDLVRGFAFIARDGARREGGSWPAPRDVAIWLSLEFRLRRPASVDRALPTTKPDRDKLERAVCDALTGVLWVDDCQVVDGPVRKLYVDAANPPGVRAIVMQLPALPRR